MVAFCNGVRRPPVLHALGEVGGLGQGRLARHSRGARAIGARAHRPLLGGPHRRLPGAPQSDPPSVRDRREDAVGQPPKQTPSRLLILQQRDAEPNEHDAVAACEAGEGGSRRLVAEGWRGHGDDRCFVAERRGEGDALRIDGAAARTFAEPRGLGLDGSSLPPTTL